MIVQHLAAHLSPAGVSGEDVVQLDDGLRVSETEGTAHHGPDRDPVRGEEGML